MIFNEVMVSWIKRISYNLYLVRSSHRWLSDCILTPHLTCMCLHNEHLSVRSSCSSVIHPSLLDTQKLHPCFPLIFLLVFSLPSFLCIISEIRAETHNPALDMHISQLPSTTCLKYLFLDSYQNLSPWCKLAQKVIRLCHPSDPAC